MIQNIMRNRLIWIWFVVALLLMACFIGIYITKKYTSHSKDIYSYNENDFSTFLHVLNFYHNDDGGFGSLPPGSVRKPDLYTTYFALYALSQIDSKIEKDQHIIKTGTWLTSQISGFEDNISLLDAYYIVMGLSTINIQPENKEKIIDHVNSYCTPEGFYYDASENIGNSLSSDIYCTYQAISIKQALGYEESKITIEWLKDIWRERNNLDIIARMQLYNSLKMIGENPVISAEDSKYATNSINASENVLQASSALEFIPKTDTKRLEFGQELAQHQFMNGGWDFYLASQNADIQGTALALKTFNQTDSPIPNRERILNMLRIHESHDGGFFSVWINGSMGITTYYAVSILKMLDQPIPKDLGKYIEKQIESQSEPNYLLPIIQLAEIANIKIVPKTELISDLNNTLSSLKLNSENDVRTAYCIIYILNYFNKPIPDNMKSAIQQQIEAMQTDTGAFAPQGKESIIADYYSIKCFEALKLNTCNHDKVVKWIKSHQDDDGLFKINGDTNLIVNYLFIDMLDAIGEDVAMKQNIVNLVQSSHNDYGGYQLKPGSSFENDTDPLLSTYCGLYLMRHLCE